MIYEVTYRALSPLHIGYRQIGILKTTRYYITGKALWGAITANLTRHLLDIPGPNKYKEVGDKYKEVGDIVKETIRATYFFPMVDGEIYFPHYSHCGSEQRELKYGRLKKSQFERTFVYSRVSTALDKTKTADENTLHETEYIKNKIVVGNRVRDVLWRGYLFVEEENSKMKIIEDNDFIVDGEGKALRASNFLERLEVGGERNYGFGKLLLIEKMKKVTEVFGHETIGCTIKSDTAFGHVCYKEIDYTGEIEPLVGREWSGKGPGRKTINNHQQDRQFVFFVPGTNFESEKNLEIADYGTWKIT
jgi:hypothetical protein